MTDKYINKKWIDTKMKHDPLYLYENKREKFDRWLSKKLGVSKAETKETPVKAAKVFSPPEPAKVQV
jgi:hypothetical protein